MRDFGDMANWFLSQPCTAHPLSVRGRDKLMNRLLQGAWDGRGRSKTDNVCVYCRSICILLGTQSLRMPSRATTRGRAIAPPEIFTNVCICIVQQQLTSFWPPENISWLRPWCRVFWAVVTGTLSRFAKDRYNLEIAGTNLFFGASGGTDKMWKREIRSQLYRFYSPWWEILIQ